MRVFAAVFSVILGASAALAQSDGRTRPDPPAAKPAAAAKAKPKPVARPKTQTETEAKTQAKAQTKRQTKRQAKTQAKTEPKTAAKAEAKTDAKIEAKTDGRGKASRKKQAKTKSKATATTTASSGSASPAALEPKSSPALRESYNAMTLADRIAIQSDLTWGGDYSGPMNGEFSDGLAEAVRTYQKRHKEAVTGLLTPEQRTALATAVAPRKEAVGWQLVEDPSTGARLGLPGKFATKTAPGPNGTRWSSEQGQLQIATFRIDTGATIEAVFEQQKKLPRRHVASSALQGDSFVITGMQGLKKMVVRGFARNGEVRGITMLYDQAMEGSIDPLVAPMSSAYVPFPSFSVASATGVARRKVEYGTGIFVSAAGHVLTDRRLAEGCNVIALPGLGNAERVAVERDGELALLRVYAARSASIGWAGAPAPGGDLTLVGIADPQAQAGEAAITAVSARIGAAADTLETAPAQGFTGAAALDAQGRFAGMVVTKPSLVAGPSGAPRANVVPVERIRSFLVTNALTLAAGAPGVDEAKAAVTRVICVRN